MIEAKMIDILLADTGVTALVGTRIDPVIVTVDTTLPSLTYRRAAGGERTYTLAGRGHYTSVVVDLYGWARDYPTARNLADQVRDALDAYMSNNAGDIDLATVVDLPDDYFADLNAYGCGLQVTLKFAEV